MLMPRLSGTTAKELNALDLSGIGLIRVEAEGAGVSVAKTDRHVGRGGSAGRGGGVPACGSVGGGGGGGGGGGEGGGGCVEDARVPLVPWSDAQRLAEQRMHWKQSLLPMLSEEGSRDEQVYARDESIDEILRSTTRAVSIQRQTDDIYAQGARAFLLTQRDEMDLQRIAGTSGNLFSTKIMTHLFEICSATQATPARVLKRSLYFL
jgi:hypothetical protein